MNLQRITTESAAPLGFTELYSEIQLIVQLSAHNFTVFIHSHCSFSAVLGCSRQLFSTKKLKNPTLHYLPSTKQQTDTVRD